MDFYKRLKQLRKDTGKLQKEIAKDLGLARSTYVGYETGYREPDLETIKKIAEYYNCSIDYLLGMTNIKNNDEKKEYIIAVEYMKNNKITLKQLEKIISLIRTFED
jgi:transcriptional regulator with XRE-family HTH domain